MKLSQAVQKNIQKQQGFTLLELLMVVAVIGILASIAVPRFQNAAQKARFTEVVNSASPYKSAVEMCIANLGAAQINNCDAGSNGIPPASTALGSVASVTVENGIITATGAAAFNIGANNATPVIYRLTPTPANFGVTWAVGGNCTDAEVNLCN